MLRATGPLLLAALLAAALLPAASGATAQSVLSDLWDSATGWLSDAKCQLQTGVVVDLSKCQSTSDAAGACPAGCPAELAKVRRPSARAARHGSRCAGAERGPSCPLFEQRRLSCKCRLAAAVGGVRRLCLDDDELAQMWVVLAGGERGD